MSTTYNDDILYFDSVNILDLALTSQTPFYLYSEKIISNNFCEILPLSEKHCSRLVYFLTVNFSLPNLENTSILFCKAF